MFMYLDYRPWIYLNIRNPFKTMKKLKGVFKPLSCYFRYNINNDWFPIIWCSNPAYIHIMSIDVGWKDKYDSPRYEYPPTIWIHIFKLNIIWYWELPHEKYMDDYWEQALWYLYYTNTISQGLIDKPDIEKAKESWPWQSAKEIEGSVVWESSWNDKYLVK